ncbi:hypothetical protein Scep_007478 [Stephania cephalantha]|uniref:Uncharacterized protein n=1 Tax=Stephania cephalantha TaxID=152367 RepID=A0AAP0PQ38_9MAGN
MMGRRFFANYPPRGQGRGQSHPHHTGGAIEYHNSAVKIEKLKSILLAIDTEFIVMKHKLQEAEHSIKKLNFGKAKLHEILSIGQSPLDHVGLGYKGGNSGGSISTTSVKASSSTDHSKNNVKAGGSIVKLKNNSGSTVKYDAVIAKSDPSIVKASTVTV